MKAEELRIGNWVINGSGSYTTVDQMDFEQWTFDNMKPIPLTPEILGKCGFELFPWGWVKKSSNDFGIRLQVHSFSYEVSGNNPVKIKYLHQLQNLYFALTGEELEIKL